MRQTIIAKRYAKALFAVSKEEDKSSEYSKSLNELEQLFTTIPEVRDALTNTLYPQDVRNKVMEHLIKALDADLFLSNFLNLLVQKKRTSAIPDIAEQYLALVDADQNISRGKVVSASEITGELQAKVQSTLENITGKKVILTTEVDPSIIGGIIAKVGDLVLDGSIRTQLAGLNESIKGSE